MSLCLSVVMPAYREAESLETLLPRIKETVSRLTDSHEIVVVDAETPLDGTREACVRHDVRHIFRSGGNHFGDAVRSGIAASRGDFVLFMDADGSHNPEHIAKLWPYRNDHDVVVGSRYVNGGTTENSAVLIFMSWVVNITFRLCFRLKCRDVTNSFRLYSGTRLRALRLESNNFDIVEELLILICSGRNPGRVLEVPVAFERRKAGESKRNLVLFAASYFATIARLMRIRRRAAQV